MSKTAIAFVVLIGLMVAPAAALAQGGLQPALHIPTEAAVIQQTESPTPTETPTGSETPTDTPTSSETPTDTPSPTETPTDTPTSSETPSETPTDTPTPS